MLFLPVYYGCTSNYTSGKFVPTIAKKIHDENPNAGIKINLVGLGIGDGFTSPPDASIYADYLYAVRIATYYVFYLIYVN